MVAMTSSMLPTLISEPNPPPSLGHKKAMQAAPKPESEKAIMPTALRLRNWRRVTPMASSSGGT